MEENKEEIQEIPDYEVLKLHKYKVYLLDEDGNKTVEKVIALPYVKTSAIFSIILGTSGDFRDLIKDIITPDGISVNIDDAKRRVIMKALDLLSVDFIMNLKDHLTEIVNVVLSEYDSEGKMIKPGNCAMLNPEDIVTIAKVVMFDMGKVIKNVFGTETTPTVTVPSQEIKDETTETTPTV